MALTTTAQSEGQNIHAFEILRRLDLAAFKNVGEKLAEILCPLAK